MWSKTDLIVLPIMLFCIIAVSALLGFLLRKKSLKIREIPLVVITVILIILEIIKQIRSIAAGYSFWSLPLHFCSMFFFWFPFAQFTTGKVKQWGKAIAFVSCILMIVFFYIGPQTIIGDSSAGIFADFGNFHTFTFHHLVILYFFCTLSCRVYKPKRSDILAVLIGYTAYFIVAASLANLLSVNFTNLLYSNISFMDTIRLACGYGFYLTIMYFFGISASILIVFVYYLIYNYIIKRRRIDNELV